MSINDLSEEERELWELAIPKSKNWQASDCPVVRDSASELQAAWKTAKRKGATLEKCKQSAWAQARERQSRRRAGKFVEQPKQIQSWLRIGRWDMEIVPDNEEKKTETKHCKCGKPVHGPDFDKCTTCLPYENGKLTGILSDELREYYRTHPEIQGYTRQQHIDSIRKNLGKIGKTNNP